MWVCIVKLCKLYFSNVCFGSVMQISMPLISVAASTDTKSSNRTSVNSQPKPDGSKKKSKPKLTRADIGIPTDFKHLQHMGYDPTTGGHLNTSSVDESILNDPVLSSLLINVGNKLGIDHNRILANKEQREFFYGFVNAHREDIYQPSPSPEISAPMVSEAPPPTPARAPAPSPGRAPPPPPPPPGTKSGTGGRAPPPPPPSSGRSEMRAPPPSQARPLPTQPPPPMPPAENR